MKQTTHRTTRPRSSASPKAPKKTRRPTAPPIERHPRTGEPLPEPRPLDEQTLFNLEDVQPRPRS